MNEMSETNNTKEQPKFPDAEQLVVQLAGCLTAASGWGQNQPANKGDYGWSPAYQSVLDLRTAYEACLDIILELRVENARLIKQKDGAYSERNKLVAVLSRLFPAWLERHPESDTDWDNDWRWIVFIDSTEGQMSWHIHDSELDQFDSLERREGDSWDGHTSKEKYERLARITGPSIVAAILRGAGQRGGRR